MFQNYLKIAFRNLWKQRSYTFINLAGMTVGMACCFLLLIFVNHERHYDEFHPNGDRLYRLNYHADFTGSKLELVRVPAPIGPRLKENFPQIEQVARLYPRSISLREVNTDKQFEIERAMFADSTVQEVFGFEFLKGDPATALHRPFSLVLTDETAERLFGENEAIGRQVLLANEGPFTVTGVIRAFPDNAHIHFEMLASYQNMVDVEPPHAREDVRRVLSTNWIASHSHTYVLLKENADPKAVDEAFPAFLDRFAMKEFVKKQAFKLFPVPDIHLQSTADDESEPVASPAYLRLFAIIGFLILLIACINFINLSTATYLSRMKEVGVRKVLGAGRGNLIGQFMGETLMLSFIALIFSLMLVDWLLPYLGGLMDKELTFSLLKDMHLTALFLLICLLAGVLAGSYPAFFASRFRPAEIFQSKIAGRTNSTQWLRKALIITQFSVGIALISGTFIILKQLNFWKSQPLGFNHEQVVAIPLFSPNMNTSFAPGDSTLRSKMNAFEDRLLQNKDIEAVTLTNVLPGLGSVRHPITTSEISLEENVFLPCLSVDYDFAETFDLQFVAGRDFGKEFGTDHINGFIVNEMTVKALNWDTPENAIGKMISRGGKEGKVVGVVKNFHTSGLQRAMEPLVMEVSVGMFNTFAIRLRGNETAATLQFLEKTWLTFFPEKAFEYHFLDDRLDSNYQQEAQLAKLGGNFAGVAIFLSCFGLFGLISLSVQQRAKEIGIRKVLGASVAGIVGLLSKEFLSLVIISLVIATPVAWYVMGRWMEDFAYRIELAWWHFAIAGAAAVLVAFMTMSFQSVKAALANPVKSLRSE